MPEASAAGASASETPAAAAEAAAPETAASAEASASAASAHHFLPPARRGRRAIADNVNLFQLIIREKVRTINPKITIRIFRFRYYFFIVVTVMKNRNNKSSELYATIKIV
jgi:hypothetical protein